MKNKIFTFTFLLLMAAGVWAQNLPNVPGTTTGLWASPQSNVTEGRYRSNADNFIRPDQYTGVRFDKWFGMISFLWDENFSPIATTGFATKVSDIYIGAFYSGNFWASKPSNNYVEEEPNTIPAGGVEGEVYDVYNSINVSTGPVNNVAVIVGAIDMGFRFTYRTNYQSFNKDNIVTGGQLYNSYETENGYMAPQIAWAFAKDMTKNGIRPYVSFDMIFNRSYQKTKTAGYDTVVIQNPDDPGNPITTYNTGEKISRSANHFDPSIGVGAGGYTFLSIDGFRLSADLDYVLTVNSYNNEYSYVENGQYKTGKINGTYIPGSNPYIERSYISNQVTPSLSGQWSKDKLALRFKINFPLTFNSEDQNSMALHEDNQAHKPLLNNGNLVYHGASNSTFTFIFRPDLRLALQYKIIPDKLTLNAGARIQATAVTLDTILQKNFINGIKTSTRKIHNESYMNSGTSTQFISRFSIGPTFNFTENAWLEANTGVTNSYGNEGTIDIFAPGGFFSFGSILFALKF